MSAKNDKAWIDDRIERTLGDLFSEDFEIRVAARETLSQVGEAAARALVEVLLKRRSDRYVVTDGAAALVEIGPAGIPAILEGLDRPLLLNLPEDVLLIDTLVGVLGYFNDPRSTLVLKRKREQIRTALMGTSNPSLRRCCEAAQIRLARSLIALGVPEGLQDLLARLGDGRKRLPEGLVEILGQVGDTRALVPLARLYAIEGSVSGSDVHLIRDAIRHIALRDPAGFDRILLKAGAAERETLEMVVRRRRSQGGA